MTPHAAHGAGRSFRPRILQVTTSDKGGGATAVALSLHRSFLAGGSTSWLAVGVKQSADSAVFQIPNSAGRSRWERALGSFADLLDPLIRRAARVWHVQRFLRAIGNPARALRRANGSEDFDYPGTWRLLDLTPSRPDVLHMHNLHGDYFDLRALPSLSERVPTVLTLHDAWMLSGHCAHSFDCARWMSGCGSCPYLSTPPAVARDDTAANWQRKLSIYKGSKLNVVTPSQWLMDKVERSMLGPVALRKRVIPNGVDLTAFRPGDRTAACGRLGLAPEDIIVLFAANGIRANPWKDFKTMRAAIQILSNDPGMRNLVFLALGEEAPAEAIGSATIRFVPFRTNPDEVADYYRAADVYMHAARADTFPNTIVEALACGTPVVATAIGGIPEQIKALDSGATSAHGATGILVEPARPGEFAKAVRHIVMNPQLRAEMAQNAVRDARERFSLKSQADAYERLYSDALKGDGGLEDGPA